ncbi:hypothetical protein [Faunimonas pinastri]|uniref:hypothetical protein n=1 Tax=Faunimonas pinastri TaxID=1855383 RepID=UPI00115FCFC3|nr:hypothetical protein [Faunimonas pinastri]
MTITGTAVMAPPLTKAWADLGRLGGKAGLLLFNRIEQLRSRGRNAQPAETDHSSGRHLRATRHDLSRTMRNGND